MTFMVMCFERKLGFRGEGQVVIYESEWTEREGRKDKGERGRWDNKRPTRSQGSTPSHTTGTRRSTQKMAGPSERKGGGSGTERKEALSFPLSPARRALPYERGREHLASSRLPRLSAFAPSRELKPIEEDHLRASSDIAGGIPSRQDQRADDERECMCGE
jgi:hypothetical protein